MAVKTQTSRHYMWSTHDRLGHGATGEVYMGYHRETGLQVAVKVLNRHSELRAIQNEISAVEKLPRHKNIVQFFASEEEKATGYPVIVMELCNSGSLYEVVDSPENAYGVEETQFKQVISDVAEGLHHLKRNGFTHRDIKPGNIMRCQLPDGSYVFKLADFGTARQLEPEQVFHSIYGTEEYLHPLMYERALINPRVKAAFKDKVDLWSVGATFFHVATGRLPFQPFEKRNDRPKMYEIITQKEKGTIMGWQKEFNGRTEYSKELPEDILLSDGLKELVTPVMAHLMENDFSKMWSFDEFFREIIKIVDMKVVDVFCISLCRCCKIYIDPNLPNAVQNLKLLIGRQTGLDPQYMELFYENLPYHHRGQRAAQLPITTIDKPITVFGGPPQTAEKLQVPVLPMCPRRPSEISIVEDLRFAKECNRVVCAYVHFAETMERLFTLMHQASHTLTEVVTHEYNELQHLSARVQTASQAVNTVLLGQIAELHSERTLISSVHQTDALNSALHQLGSSLAAKQEQLNQAPGRTNSLQRQQEDFEPQLSQLKELWDPKLCRETFDKSGARAMSFYLKSVQSLFQQLQHERKMKGGVLSTPFDRKVHDSVKVQLESRMLEAREKLDLLVKARSTVYSKLYSFLGLCISIREDVQSARESLESYEKQFNTELEELDAWGKDHQQMIQGLQYELRESSNNQPSINQPSIPTSISPEDSYLPQIISAVQRLRLSSDQVSGIVTSQSNLLTKLSTDTHNGTRKK